MAMKHGTQTVDIYNDKRIIKSGAVGTTNVEEIKWLVSTLKIASASWKLKGWGYICDISKMSPVSPEASAELINLHKMLAEANCKAMAFIDFGSFVTGAQAKEHQKKSNVAIQEGHFRTEKDAIAWIQTIVK